MYWNGIPVAVVTFLEKYERYGEETESNDHICCFRWIENSK